MSTKASKTTIMVSKETKEKLDEIRREIGSKNYSDVIERLIQVYREYDEKTSEETIRKTLCEKYINARFSLTALGKILEKHGFKRPMHLSIAMRFIRETDDGVFEVVKEKCVSQ